MSGKFQSYVAFVDGIPIGIETLTAISHFCNVRRRDMKKLAPQKWRHGGRPHKKPKKPMKRCSNCAWKNYAGKYIAKHRVDKSTGIDF